MPRGGHNRKSIAEKKANGTYRPSVDGDRIEAKAKQPRNLPKSPAEFDANHTELWYQVCKILHETGNMLPAVEGSVKRLVEVHFMLDTAWKEWQKTKKAREYITLMNTYNSLSDRMGFNLKALQGLKMGEIKEEEKDGDDIFPNSAKG